MNALAVLAAALLAAPAAAAPAPAPPTPAQVRAAYDAIRHGFCGLEENVEFGCQSSCEAAAKLLPAAGGDGGYLAVAGEESLEAGKGSGGFGQRVQAEFKEFGFLGRRALPHFRWGFALNGDAKLAQAQPGNRRRGS